MLKSGRRGDNLTPHHIPANAYMKAKVPSYTTNQGIAIMIEHFSPGKGGRHRQTLSYGKSPNKDLSPRKTLARDIRDLRSIYIRQNLYDSEIRRALQEVIRLNKLTWKEIFNEGVRER